MKKLKHAMFLSFYLCNFLQINRLQAEQPQDFLYTTARTIASEAQLFGKQFIVALLVHYLGQTCTNTLYKIAPSIGESIIRPVLSGTQTLSSYNITHEIYLKIANHNHIFAHVLGWFIATYLPKPASIISDLLEKYRNSNQTEKIMT